MRHAAQAMLALLLLLAAPVWACFGPKLYLGTLPGPEGDVLHAVVSLYLKEKTGVETVRVALAGKEPLAEIRAERVDLAFTPEAAAPGPALLAVPGLPRLLSGPRPLADLQFTTVAPALKKLEGLLTAGDIQALAAQVRRGDSAAAAARRLLSARGWI